MLLLIHWKSFEFSTWLTREMFIWLKNSTLGTSNSEDFHYLHWRLVADYPGHVTTYFRTQCQRPVHPKDLICDIRHSIKIKYPYTKPQSPTPFNSNSHLATFVRNCGAKPFCKFSASWPLSSKKENDKECRKNGFSYFFPCVKIKNVHVDDLKLKQACTFKRTRRIIWYRAIAT